MSDDFDDNVRKAMESESQQSEPELKLSDDTKRKAHDLKAALDEGRKKKGE